MNPRVGSAILIAATLACAALLVATSCIDGLDFVSRAGTSSCKLVCLVVGAMFTVHAVETFEPGSPARRGWSAFAVWQIAWALGQAWFCFVVIVLRRSVTVPSIADILFIGGQLAALYALYTFIGAWTGSGITTSPRWAKGLGGGIGVLTTAVAIGMILLARHGALPYAESIVVGLYPVLDCVALWPLLILLAMAAGMGGGQLAIVWRRMLLGMLACTVGDFAYAFFAQLGVMALDPVIDFAFCASYAYIAAGAVQQKALAAT